MSFLVSTDSRWALLPLPCQQTTAYHGNKVDIDGTENRLTDRQFNIKRSLGFFHKFLFVLCANNKYENTGTLNSYYDSSIKQVGKISV